MSKLLKTISVLLTIAILATVAVIPSSAAGSSISSASKISFGSTYNDSITESAPKDFYSMTLSSSGEITLSFNAQMQAVDLYLYDTNGTEIWKNTSVNANSASGMIAYNVSFDLTKGTYYFGVVKDYNRTGDYSFSFSFASSNEYFTETGTGTDNAIGSANNIAFNYTYKGQIALNDNKDFFKIELPSSGTLNLQFNAKISNVDLYLFNQNGEEVWKNSSLDATNSTGEISYNNSLNLTKGIYFLGIVKDYIHTGNYSFNLSFTSANESFTETNYGTNNSMDTAESITLNTIYQGQIALIDDKDFYKFTLASSSNINLSLNAKINAVDLYIYDNTGKEVWKNNYISASNNSGEIAFTTKIDLTKGTYYLGIIKDYTSTGTYNFSLSTNGSVITPPDTPTAKTLSSISVITLPKKTDYSIGESLDTTGMAVKAKYSDGTSAVVTNYRVSGFDSSKAGTSVVSVSYSENGITKTTSFSVTVNEADGQAPGDNGNGGFSFDAVIEFFNGILAFFAEIVLFIIDLFSSLA